MLSLHVKTWGIMGAASIFVRGGGVQERSPEGQKGPLYIKMWRKVPHMKKRFRVLRPNNTSSATCIH